MIVIQWGSPQYPGPLKGEQKFIRIQGHRALGGSIPHFRHRSKTRNLGQAAKLNRNQGEKAQRVRFNEGNEEGYRVVAKEN